MRASFAWLALLANEYCSINLPHKSWQATLPLAEGKKKLRPRWQIQSVPIAQLGQLLLARPVSTVEQSIHGYASINTV